MASGGPKKILGLGQNENQGQRQHQQQQRQLWIDGLGQPQGQGFRGQGKVRRRRLSDSEGSSVSVPVSAPGSGFASGGRGRGNRNRHFNKKGQTQGQGQRRPTFSPPRFEKDDDGDIQILPSPIFTTKPNQSTKSDQPQSSQLTVEAFMAQDPITVYPSPRKNPDLFSSSSNSTVTVPPNFSYFSGTEEKSTSASSSTSASTPQSANWLMSFANNSSFGSFVATDSRFGNSIIPALPRLDSQGNFLN